MTQELRTFARVHLAKSHGANNSTKLLTLLKNNGWTYELITKTFTKEIPYGPRHEEHEARRTARLLHTTSLKGESVVMSSAVMFQDQGQDAFAFHRAYILCFDAYQVSQNDMDKHDFKPYTSKLEMPVREYREMLRTLTERCQLYKLEEVNTNNERFLLGQYLNAYNRTKKTYASTLRVLAQEIAERDANAEDASEEIDSRKRTLAHRDEDLQELEKWIRRCSPEVKQREFASELEMTMLRDLDQHEAEHSEEETTKITTTIFNEAKHIVSQLNDDAVTFYLLGTRRTDLINRYVFTLERMIEKALQE